MTFESPATVPRTLDLIVGSLQVLNLPTSFLVAVSTFAGPHRSASSLLEGGHREQTVSGRAGIHALHGIDRDAAISNHVKMSFVPTTFNGRVDD